MSPSLSPDCRNDAQFYVLHACPQALKSFKAEALSLKTKRRKDGKIHRQKCPNGASCAAEDVIVRPVMAIKYCGSKSFVVLALQVTKDGRSQNAPTHIDMYLPERLDGPTIKRGLQALFLANAMPCYENSTLSDCWDEVQSLDEKKRCKSAPEHTERLVQLMGSRQNFEKTKADILSCDAHDMQVTAILKQIERKKNASPAFHPL